MEHYAFDDKFQVKLLGILYSGNINSTLVSPEYFSNPIYGAICETLLSLKQLYGNITPDMVKNNLLEKKDFKDRDYRAELLISLPQVFKSIKDSEQSYIRDLAFKFAKLQRYKSFLRESYSILQEDDTDTVEKLDSLFSHLDFDTGLDQDLGQFYFSSLQERLLERSKNPDIIRSMIKPLDDCLDGGGFGCEDLTLLAGLPSSGKSFALLRIAKMAVLQLQKVVFYSLEMTTNRLSGRLDASFTGTPTHQLRNLESSIIEARLKDMRIQVGGDNLLMKRFPAGKTTVSMLESHLNALKFKGFFPRVIVIDYINLMQPEEVTKEGRHRDLGSVYVALKGLAQSIHGWVFTGAQSNRAGFNSPLITMRDLAESFEGAAHSDIIVTINRNDEEAAAEQVRLYVAKDRNGVDKRIIKGYTDYKNGNFWSDRHSQGLQGV